MIGLTDQEIYISILILIILITNFELYKDIFDKFSIEKLKDELEEILYISNITDNHLEGEIIGPHIIKTYWKLRSEKSSTEGYIILIMAYARSPFPDFESFLRIVVGLDEDDFQLV